MRESEHLPNGANTRRASRHTPMTVAAVGLNPGASAPRQRRLASPSAVAHPSRDARRASGKAARAAVPRTRHSELRIDTAHRDPVALLAQQALSRVPELVPIRYGRMIASEFAFFRGAAAVMASDLQHTPNSGITVQLCGDAHLSNFGVFGSPERRLIFDINDFDETHPGPWEWDLKRLVVSFEIACRDQGIPARERTTIVARVVHAYRHAMNDFAGKSNLEVWYARLDTESYLSDARAGIGRDLHEMVIGRAERVLKKARTKDSMHALSRMTHRVDGQLRITPDPPRVVPLADLVDMDDLSDWTHLMLQGYRQTLQPDRRYLLEQYRLVDVARKVVGVGSVGTRCFIALLLGADDSDPLFLQVKEAQASVLEPFLGTSMYANHGERVIAGQRTMQAVSDIFLGWQREAGDVDGIARDFYWRQLRDWKGSADVAQMDPMRFMAYADLCGWTLARAHARSGDRIALAAYVGRSARLDEAMTEFACQYADLNARDYARLCAAVAEGRITADLEGATPPQHPVM